MDEETKFERMKKLRDRHLRKREMLQVSLKNALRTIRDLQLDRNRWIKKYKKLKEDKS
jgi:hypothetical protein